MSSSSRLCLLMWVAACNQVYGLEPTNALPPIDAQYFDAPIDAPFSCPPIGTTPHFDSLLHQPIVQYCNDYTIGGDGRALARCREFAVGEGATDQALMKTTGFVSEQTLFGPRIAPEGDEAFVVYVVNRSTPAEVHAYRSQGPATWSHEYQVQTPSVLPAFVRVGTPSAGLPRRMMLWSAGMIYELSIDAAGVATVHDTYSPSDLGVSFINGAPNLTPDGLRMVMPGISVSGSIARPLYSDRSSLAGRFRAVDEIDAFAFADDPFLTPDCGRIYFSAVQSVLFVQRRDPP